MKTFKAVAVFKGRGFGYFGGKRVYNGDMIDVTDAEFSGKWMRRLRKEREVKSPKAMPVKQVGTGLL